MNDNCFIFFQAEDGIRDYKVTGVQTCALPICSDCKSSKPNCHVSPGLTRIYATKSPAVHRAGTGLTIRACRKRSEERRVGKECRYQRERNQSKDKESTR